MNKRTIKKISKTIYKQFPEMNGCAPKIEKNEKAQAKSLGPVQSFILTYNTIGLDPVGREVHRQVRVTANGKGKILRISTIR